MVSEIIQKRMIATSQNGAGIKYSDDFGSTFEDTNITTGSFDTPIHTHNGVWLARALGDGAEGIWRSTDGANWNQVLSENYQEIDILSDGALFVTSLISGRHSKISEGDGVTWRNCLSLEERSAIAYCRDKFDSNISSAGEGRDLMDVLRCTSLQDLCQKLRYMSDHREFRDLRETDYFDLPSFVYNGQTYLYNEQYQNLRMEIAGIDIYKAYYPGEIDNKPGILFQCKNIPFLDQMEATQINTNIKFSNTQLGQRLNNSVNSVETTLGIELKSVKRYYCGNGGDTSKIFLPTEIEASGKNWAGAEGLQNLNSDTMWPIFKKYPQKRVKYYNGDRKWWWCCNPAAVGGCFCNVGTSGGARCNNAYNSHGVSFAFYI